MTTYALPVPTNYVDHQARHTVVLDGPAYVIGPRSTRWHRIRSRVEVTDRATGEHIRTVISAWCGTHVRDGVAWDHIENDPRCGTCEGRWEGWARERNLVFDPSTSDRRTTKCPGSRASTYAKTVNWITSNGGICRYCGAPVSARAYGWNGARIVTHESGPNLPDPCPIHGHLALTLTADGAVCACEVDA